MDSNTYALRCHGTQLELCTATVGAADREQAVAQAEAEGWMIHAESGLDLCPMHEETGLILIE
jgi:hypothetical protein